MLGELGPALDYATRTREGGRRGASEEPSRLRVAVTQLSCERPEQRRLRREHTSADFFFHHSHHFVSCVCDRVASSWSSVAFCPPCGVSRLDAWTQCAKRLSSSHHARSAPLRTDPSTHTTPVSARTTISARAARLAATAHATTRRPSG